MTTNPNYEHQLVREHASTLFSPVSYDEASRMFYTADSQITFGWVSNPIVGANQTIADKLNMLLSMQFPAGSVMQFCLWASPDIDGYINEMLGLRRKAAFGNHPVLEQAMLDKADFLMRGTTERLNDRVYGILRDFALVVSVKVPATKGSLPSDKEWRVAAELRTAIEKSLETIGLGPVPLTQQIYLHILGTMLNWGEHRSWRNGGPAYDPKTLLNEQVVDFDTSVEITEAGLRLGRKEVRVLSPKRYPDYVNLAAMHLMIGDLKHGRDGIAGNFISTMNVFFPDAVSERAKQDGKRNVVNYQALGPVAMLNSKLREMKAGFDDLYQGLDSGDRIVKVQHTFVLFADNEEQATQAVTGMVSYYRDLQFQVQQDRFISLPLFLGALPLNADNSPKALNFLKRFRTFGSSDAANLAPIVSDWKGTRRPVLTYISRNQQLMGVDLFESSSNMNFVVAAQSGAGKSFLANDLIVSYLSMGAKVYVIDVGRSYLKLCEVLDGISEFMVFSKESNLCLNPFQLVKDFEDEGSMLTDIIKAMSSRSGRLDDWQTSLVTKVIASKWSTLGNTMTVDDVAAGLADVNDSRARDLSDQLYPFTSQGEYGRWFVGQNNVRFDKQLTVLELEELKGKPHLQIVVLLLLIYQIQQDMYLGDRSVPRLILVDESWSLFAEGDVAAFIISAYRRCRKYGAAMGIITQSISDLYANETVGLPMLENSAWMFLLGQKGESVDFMKNSKRLSLSDAGFDLLKTVQTVRGRFSEIFIYCSSYSGGVGAGIGRLIVSRFSQLLYTTDARELSAIKVYQDRGMSLPDAINAVIGDEQKPA